MGRVIVVGASAGGVPALQALVAGFPPDFPAPVLVVLHVGTHRSMLPELLSRAGSLPAAHATQGEPLRPGHLHIAPPDHHMLLHDNTILLTRGPKQHHARPAIDPLFRSAALAHGPDVVGVVLTGMLDDGTVGLQAVKQAGGTAVVQDPRDAMAPSMPQSALRHVAVDHCVPLADMPGLLKALAGQAAGPRPARPPRSLLHEQALLLADGLPMEHLNALGRSSPFVCPDCHGNLWAISGSRPPCYACHTGHMFTLRSLQHTLSLATDDTVWNALRAMQEKGVLLRHMAGLQQDAGQTTDAQRLDALAEQMEQQVRMQHTLTEAAPQPEE